MIILPIFSSTHPSIHSFTLSTPLCNSLTSARTCNNTEEYQVKNTNPADLQSSLQTQQHNVNVSGVSLPDVVPTRPGNVIGSDDSASFVGSHGGSKPSPPSPSPSEYDAVASSMLSYTRANISRKKSGFSTTPVSRRKSTSEGGPLSYNDFYPPHEMGFDDVEKAGVSNSGSTVQYLSFLSVFLLFSIVILYYCACSED